MFRPSIIKAHLGSALRYEGVQDVEDGSARGRGGKISDERMEEGEKELKSTYFPV